MDSTLVRDQLICSVCLELYKGPVTLPCGHNFCRDCIKKTWDHQEEREYSCPECIRRYRERPELNQNTRLRDIADVFQEKEKNKSTILCTYCIDNPTPAVKSCLQCEASFCDKHREVHSKSAEHILTEPTSDHHNKKCSIHKESLEYYCPEDSACICKSCKLQRTHRGHAVETLAEATKKKKVKCRRIIAELTTRRTETEKNIHGLRKHKGDMQEKATGIADRVASLFRASRRQMEDLERRVLSELTNTKEQISGSVSGTIHQLEIKLEELSKKIRLMQELCSTNDPLTVMQESDQGEEGDNEDGAGDDGNFQGAGDLNEPLISLGIWKELTNIVNNATKQFLVLEYSDVYLDESSAAANVKVSDDLKGAQGVEYDDTIEPTLQAFMSYQVLSRTVFYTGRHYWEVDIKGINNFRIGMCYASMDRAGSSSIIGNNGDSWCLVHSDRMFSFRHFNNDIMLPRESFIKGLGIYLDYEAGRLSFYEVCDPVRHLHTFTDTFTEPLHAVFRVGSGVFLRIRS